MKERPILFSGPMVRAILECRKSMTRRVVKGHVCKIFEGVPHEWHGPCDAQPITCPYGVPGDRLWVRETHRFDGIDQKLAILDKRVDELMYRADMAGDRAINDCPWRPSIFMPRWASRITLEVTAVRVERLQEITEDDARSEGCLPVVEIDGSITCGTRKISFSKLWDSINTDRPKLPENVNSKRYARVKRWLEKHPPCAWNANPWVWVVEFRRV